MRAKFVTALKRARHLSLTSARSIQSKPPQSTFNPLHAKLNPTCHLLALLGAHYIFHVSGLRVKIHCNIIRLAAI